MKQKQDIEIVRGTSNELTIRLAKKNGDPYELAPGEKVIFGVKRDTAESVCTLTKCVTAVVDGLCVVEIAPEDTEGLTCGKYFYDVGLLAGDKYYNVIPPSVFRITPNVTCRGDGA